MVLRPRVSPPGALTDTGLQATVACDPGELTLSLPRAPLLQGPLVSLRCLSDSRSPLTLGRDR